jgi:HAE1 family hydrophobic/amphiphilic exporter-1
MLTGVVSKNAVLLVDYTNTLRKEGKGVREALLGAAPVRFRPIVMTSCTLICSMLPLALGVGPGGEQRSPMAVVMIGGMLTSTLLTLFFVPALYTYFDDLQNLPGQIRALMARRRAPRAARGAEREEPVARPVPGAATPEPALATDGAAGD